MKVTVYVVLEKGFPVYSSEYKEDAVETMNYLMNYLTNNGENSENFELITEEVNEEDLF